VNEIETTGDECVDIVREDLETKRDGTTRNSSPPMSISGRANSSGRWSTAPGMDWNSSTYRSVTNMGVIMKELITTTAMFGINKAGAVNPHYIRIDG
jgi:hypothetical protein